MMPRYVRSEEVVSAPYGDFILIHHLRTDQYLHLEGVDVIVWERLDGTKNAEGIVAGICTELRIDEPEIAARAHSLIERLRLGGFVQEVPDR